MLYHYEIYFDLRDKASQSRDLVMSNGPHDFELSLTQATASLYVQLRHLPPDPADPSNQRLRLTLTERP